MPKERLSMTKTKEVLRLKFSTDLSNRQIATSLGIARSTVADYLQRAEEAGIGWPLPAGLSDAQLEQRLFTKPQLAGDRHRAAPDWPHIHQHMKRKGVTLTLLWQEYQEQHPQGGYQYSQFANLYRQWVGTLDVVMRQSHAAGEKLFVDYAGQTVGVIDRHSGEIREAQIFVAALGASNYTYAEATWTQEAPEWIGSHVRAFAFFGGCTEVLVPDNLKSAVTRAHRYDPDLNRSYADMARFYGVAIVPARVRKPKDKAVAENGVQRVEQWILARLRNHQFFSLGELNTQIQCLLAALNDKPFQKLPGSRRSQFEALDRPALKALPAQRYELAEWLKARVAPNIHIRVAASYYSVPYVLVKKEVEVRLSARTVEVLYQGQRVASHRRSHTPGHYETLKEHMPEGHQRHLQWTPQRLLRWAGDSGPPYPGPDPGGAREPPLPPTGLQRLSGHHAPGQKLRRRASGSGLSPGAALRYHPLQERGVDPQARPGQPTAA